MNQYEELEALRSLDILNLSNKKLAIWISKLAAGLESVPAIQNLSVDLLIDVLPIVSSRLDDVSASVR